MYWCEVIAVYVLSTHIATLYELVSMMFELH